MPKACSYKFLVIDSKNLINITNLTRKVNHAVKYPEPMLKLDAPWDTEKMEAFDWTNVLYDPEEKLFKMWYGVAGRQPGRYWETGRKTAYALSKDGINWEKPIMNMVEIRGSKKNNYIIQAMLCLNYNIIIDPSDIPSRRYKITFIIESKETQWADFHLPLCIGYSADGIHWDIPPHVNPVLRGIADGIWGFLYDSDRRKYQLYTRRVPNLPRDISLYESYDLVNWEDMGRVLVPGDEYDPPEMYNLHSLTPFFYEDFCLGLLETMYFLPGAEGYTVFHRPPEEWPFKNLGVVDVQFSYSRDGQQWLRPVDRSPLIGIGDADAPDGGGIFKARNGPIVIDGETWIYYSASRCRHTAWWQQENRFSDDERDRYSCMLAKMPEDHWMSLDGGKDGGSFTTKPWGPPHEIFVNADAKSGSIEAELVTPYGQPVKEYTRKDCIAVTANGKSQPLKWKNGKSAWETIAKDHLGGLLIKFYVTNAKLYSYTFTLPDPDGQLERDRLNARWCDHIKHRSDNWGRNSNDSAGGVAPFLV